MNDALNQSKVMVIDDDEFIQRLLDDTLRGEGYSVYVADSAEHALQLIENEIPDIFIVDIILPGQDGFELCKKIRENPKTKFKPILILSSKHAVSERVKGLQIGADDYLVKPFHLEELIARVHALLRRTRDFTKVQELQIKPEAVKPPIIQPIPDAYEERKKFAGQLFKDKHFEKSLQLWEELSIENPKDIEVKRYLEIVRVQLMKHYLEVLKSKDAVPIRKSNRAEDFIGLDFNTEEGFIFSRIDGVTDLKGIVAISGMKPLKAYGILYNLHKSGVITLKERKS
ncbi:response regulator [bacterium]|nr:response regulator [candidate division CSSED10-310 bacterium]